MYGIDDRVTIFASLPFPPVRARFVKRVARIFRHFRRLVEPVWPVQRKRCSNRTPVVRAVSDFYLPTSSFDAPASIAWSHHPLRAGVSRNPLAVSLSRGRRWHFQVLPAGNDIDENFPDAATVHVEVVRRQYYSATLARSQFRIRI